MWDLETGDKRRLSRRGRDDSKFWGGGGTECVCVAGGEDRGRKNDTNDSQKIQPWVKSTILTAPHLSTSGSRCGCSCKSTGKGRQSKT